MKKENSPRPWSIIEHHQDAWAIIDAKGVLIDNPSNERASLFTKDVAEHIVKCVNDDARETVVGKRVMNDACY